MAFTVFSYDMSLFPFARRCGSGIATVRVSSSRISGSGRVVLCALKGRGKKGGRQGSHELRRWMDLCMGTKDRAHLIRAVVCISCVYISEPRIIRKTESGRPSLQERKKSAARHIGHHPQRHAASCLARKRTQMLAGQCSELLRFTVVSKEDSSALRGEGGPSNRMDSCLRGQLERIRRVHSLAKYARPLHGLGVETRRKK